MKPSDIFDTCLERVRLCQAQQIKLGAINPMASAKDGPPKNGAPLSEYVADFEKCGRRVLLKRWPNRFKLFQLYHCQNEPVSIVKAVLALKDGTFWWWCDQIKIAVGPELQRCSLFPPTKYFRERAGAQPWRTK